MDSFFGIGLPEFVLILVIAGMVMGPERIVRVARTLGVISARLQNISQSFFRQLGAELDSVDDTGALRSTAEELKQLKKQVADLRDEVFTLTGDGVTPRKASKTVNGAAGNSIMPPSLAASLPHSQSGASSENKGSVNRSLQPARQTPVRVDADGAADARVIHSHQLPRRVDIPEDPDA